MSGATEAFSHVRIPDVNPELGQPVILNGPMLEALKGIEGKKLRLPERTQDHPDRDRLALRYGELKAME